MTFDAEHRDCKSALGTLFRRACTREHDTRYPHTSAYNVIACTLWVFLCGMTAPNRFISAAILCVGRWISGRQIKHLTDWWTQMQRRCTDFLNRSQEIKKSIWHDVRFFGLYWIAVQFLSPLSCSMCRIGSGSKFNFQTWNSSKEISSWIALGKATNRLRRQCSYISFWIWIQPKTTTTEKKNEKIWYMKCDVQTLWIQRNTLVWTKRLVILSFCHFSLKRPHSILCFLTF